MPVSRCWVSRILYVKSRAATNIVVDCGRAEGVWDEKGRTLISSVGAAAPRSRLCRESSQSPGYGE
jgi:hypothetical protein